MDQDFIKDKVVKGEYDLSVHAHNERQNEKITVKEIEQVLLKGVIIEQYPKDPRGGSCLVSGVVSKKPLHLVCGMRGDRLLIVTNYRPKPPVWINYTTRAKELKSRE